MAYFGKLAAIALGMALAAAPASATELVTNGGFETGTLDGYTLSPDIYRTFVQKDLFGSAKATGTYELVLGDGTISQTLATVAGQVYTVSFTYTNPFNEYSNMLTATFGGTTIFKVVDAPEVPTATFTYMLPATGPDTVLAFTSKHDQGQFVLDNISVTGQAAASSVPEMSAWALMLAGFGAIGTAIRRARRVGARALPA